MNTRLLHLWIRLTSSFWFVPSLMTTAAFGFSFLMIALDEHVDSEYISELGWLYTNKPEGAREVLSTIAGSMITVAGVVFSVTIVALSLASSQFGPRLLSNFMRDKGNQVVLGTFISTYFYCLLILRTIRSGDQTTFVPHLSVAVGVLFAICSLGVLIYFIHHVSESIQVSSVIGKVAADLSLIIDQQYPAEPVKPKNAHTSTETSSLQPGSVKANVLAVSSGYLQAIDQRLLVALADEHNLFVEICHTVGSFIVCGQPIAVVQSEEKCPERVNNKVQDCFIFGSERSIDQDILFPINQLVEVALRALSPGINDPFTAISCLHRLTAALCEVATRPIPTTKCLGENGVVRAKIPRVHFPELLEVAFSQIRIFGKTNPEVMLQLLNCICLINKCIQNQNNANSLLHQAKLIIADGLENMHDAAMRERFLQQYQLLQTERGIRE